MRLLSKLLNAKEFKNSFDSLYHKFSQANEDVNSYYREKAYEYMQDKITYGYNNNNSGSYDRTYALMDTLEAPVGKTPLGDTFSLGWNDKRSNYMASSRWGDMVVQGTHRTFFGYSSMNLEVGDTVEVPLILNDSKRHNLNGNRNYFYQFIDDTGDYIEYDLLRKHEKHFLDFFIE